MRGEGRARGRGERSVTGGVTATLWLFFLSSSLSLFPAATALTFTSPSSNSVVDPTKDFEVTWSSSSSDPSTFNLVTSSPTLLGGKTVGQDISTASGTYKVPAGTIQGWGTLAFVATGSGGNTLATSHTFSLAQGAFSVSVEPNGAGSTLVSETLAGTVSGTDTHQIPGTSLSGTYDPYTLSANSASATGSGGSATATVSTVSGTRTQQQGTTMSTSTTGSSSGSRSSSASATAASTSANAQARIGGSGQEVALTLAGLLAGLVALMA